MGNHMSLTKEQILAADDLGLLEVQVPEWGGSVFIRVMSVGERDAYENDWLVNKSSGVENFRAKFVQKVLCNERGDLLFTKNEIDQLARKSAKVMSTLWEAAMRHNKLSESDVEELAKN
jgi:hypothetical protein